MGIFIIILLTLPTTFNANLKHWHWVLDIWLSIARHVLSLPSPSLMLYILFFQLSAQAFTILYTASNDQLYTEPRLYHYHWSWVLPGLLWLSDATNDVQFYWAVRLQWRRVCWSGRCCGVSTHPAWLDLMCKCNSVTIKV